ncbi:hypothetical protein V6N11_049991 [Hibiscus sabdariffa]|uniref:Uncharacterized protein n=1 Tax=Hibiscus sabdariffa TaxID=183260 RepID=A0ABR2T8M1_9ROSI
MNLLFYIQILKCKERALGSFSCLICFTSIKEGRFFLSSTCPPFFEGFEHLSTAKLKPRKNLQFPFNKTLISRRRILEKRHGFVS